MRALDIYAGPKALAQIRDTGLRAQDVAAIPAAAGGPKGLILQALDQWLFGSWLPSAVRERSLIGASIGAWRMAAACAPDPVAAFERLGYYYSSQRYPKKPPPQMVSAMCKQLLKDVIDGHESAIVHHPHYRLHLLAIRGIGPLSAPRNSLTAMTGFARATFSNLRARKHLAAHMERVIVGDARDALSWMKPDFDAFTTHFVPLSETNLSAALLASATLPMVMEAVLDIPSAPTGHYWDGGLVDYHLAFPYARMLQTPTDLMFYPHFTSKIVPGWLDKSLPWRHASSAQQGNWYDNVVMVAPSKEFQQTLPRKKLPDRKDFHFYGLDHDARIRNWKKAMSEAQRLRDEMMAFVEKPDINLIKPL